MIKTTRCHYSKQTNEKSLEDTLNELTKADNDILFITSDYYGQGEVAYTIIFEGR